MPLKTEIPLLARPEPFAVVKDQLLHGSFYVIHGRDEQSEDCGWRVAWWCHGSQNFYDNHDGEEIVMQDLLVHANPLPFLEST